MPAPKKKAPKRRIAKPPRRPAQAHLLIIECDSQKLASQGMHLGIGFGDLAKKLFPKKRIAVVQTSTETKLKDDLAEVFKEFVFAAY